MDRIALSELDRGDPRRIGWIGGLPDARLEDDLGPACAGPAEAAAPLIFWGRRNASDLPGDIALAIEPDGPRSGRRLRTALLGRGTDLSRP